MQLRLAGFKRKIETQFPGCVLEDDGVCLHLTAPAGYSWDGDLHEFVAQHRPSLTDKRDPIMMAEAIGDLQRRVETPRLCNGENCDWCNPNL